MSKLKYADIRARGEGYSDTYSDTYAEADVVAIVAHKFGVVDTYSEGQGHQVLSSPFQYEGELEGHGAIWTAITSTWVSRAALNTLELRGAMNSALDAAGYTAVGGGPLV